MSRYWSKDRQAAWDRLQQEWEAEAQAKRVAERKSAGYAMIGLASVFVVVGITLIGFAPEITKLLGI